MIKNPHEIVFRASAWGDLITNDRTGKDMGQTAKKACIKIYAEQRYGRREDIKSKFLDKGNEREEDSITLLSRFTKTVYKKNAERLRDDYFTGEPDLFLGPEIRKADETDDTKSSWSLITFLEAQTKCESDDVSKGYYWQGQTYMALTGARKHTVSYCLVNGTHKILSDEMRKLQWTTGTIDMDHPSPDFIKKAQQLERNHIFDRKAFAEENPGYDFFTPLEEWDGEGYDIPHTLRVSRVTFDRNEEDINRMIGRALLGRTWIAKNLWR